MKTAVIWDECDVEIEYCVVDGDWSRFEGVMINGEESSMELRDELSSLAYDEDGKFVLPTVTQAEFTEQIRQGAEIVKCGFYHKV